MSAKAGSHNVVGTMYMNNMLEALVNSNLCKNPKYPVIAGKPMYVPLHIRFSGFMGMVVEPPQEKKIAKKTEIVDITKAVFGSDEQKVEKVLKEIDSRNKKKNFGILARNRVQNLDFRAFYRFLGTIYQFLAKIVHFYKKGEIL